MSAAQQRLAMTIDGFYEESSELAYVGVKYKEAADAMLRKWSELVKSRLVRQSSMFADNSPRLGCGLQSCSDGAVGQVGVVLSRLYRLHEEAPKEVVGL
jgi:hypothetical protein